MGGGGATGGGHGNMHSLGGNVSNYGSHHQQQQYHSMMGPSRPSYGSASLPPVSSMFGHGPSQGNSYMPPNYPGASDFYMGSRGESKVKRESDSMATGKCLLCIK